jgi:hypothetical protein
MYQDDREALHQLAESATQESNRLRRENEAMRQAVGRMQPSQVPVTLALAPHAIYHALDLRTLPLEERARLASHSVTRFPVWLVGILNVLTLGIFPLIHFGMIHDRLPRAAHNDPSSGKAIGFTFIPYYNLYWVFFNSLRLCDRLTLQFRLRGRRDSAPKGMLLAACIVGVIPYVNLFIGLPILWTIAVCLLQSSVNKVADLGADTWDASQPGDARAMIARTGAQSAGAAPAMLPSYQLPPPSPEQLATAARAKKLVNLSHILGWGGLACLLVGTSVAGVAGGVTAAGIVGTLSAVSVIVGAIVGQVGRGMQGRAI